jgi:predicted TPR repeat methyltransferase
MDQRRVIGSELGKCPDQHREILKVAGSLIACCGRPVHACGTTHVAKADASDIDFGNSVRCVGGVTAVPETTDYDTIAERYAANIDDRPWNALYERPTTLALLPVVDGTDVLDAGCGHGWYADWLLRHGARVVAVDRSAAMVALTQKRIGGRARIIQGDVRDLRGILADQSFDLVL